MTTNQFRQILKQVSTQFHYKERKWGVAALIWQICKYFCTFFFFWDSLPLKPSDSRAWARPTDASLRSIKVAVFWYSSTRLFSRRPEARWKTKSQRHFAPFALKKSKIECLWGGFSINGPVLKWRGVWDKLIMKSIHSYAWSTLVCTRAGVSSLLT